MIAKFKEQPRLNSALGAICIGLIVLGWVAIGPASQSSGQSTRTATVQRGVVQSTVSGTGNVQSSSQLNLGFKTSGTVTHIYVTKGQHVTKGQLLATVDPQGAEVTLEQAKASLQSAEANLAKDEEGNGETSSTQGASATGTTPTANAAYTASAAYTANVAYTASAPATAAPTNAPGKPNTTTTPSTTTTKTPAPSTPSKSTTTSSPTPSGSSTKASGTSGGSATSGGGGQSTSSAVPTQSAATREANLASARATVKSAQVTVQSDEKALRNTKLYAPQNGTIVALSGEVGETVASTGTTRASSASSTSTSGSSTGAGSGSTPAATSSSSGGSSGSTSSPFAVLSSLESMQLVVPLSQSEIGNVKVGQIATVTIEALSGRKVAAHVLSIDQLPTTSSGVVSYNVTFHLDQGASGVKTGMSATAEIVVKQEQGLNVPSSAISGGSVTVVRSGKHVAQPVTTGLVGNGATILLSGVAAGEEVVLPTATSTPAGSSTRGRTGGLGGGGLGGGGLGGGGLGGGGLAGGGPPAARGGQ